MTHATVTSRKLSTSVTRVLCIPDRGEARLLCLLETTPAIISPEHTYELYPRCYYSDTLFFPFPSRRIVPVHTGCQLDGAREKSSSFSANHRFGRALVIQPQAKPVRGFFFSTFAIPTFLCSLLFLASVADSFGAPYRHDLPTLAN